MNQNKYFQSAQPVCSDTSENPESFYTPSKTISWFATLSVCIAIAILIHVFVRVSSSSPYIAVDDALANVSVTLSNTGVHGFIASPVQGGSGSLRHNNFLNYGPLPFYMGAALDWFFGSSYTVLRFVHPLGLVMVMGLGWMAFRRFWLGGGLINALLTLALFWSVQWPMFRPDIAVSVSIAIAISASTSILLRPSRFAYFALGLGVLGAFTTHQIAWVVVPWGITMLIYASASSQEWPGSVVQKINTLKSPILWFGFGGLIVVGLYLHAIGFRVHDVWDLWVSAIRIVNPNNGQLSWGKVLSMHFVQTWSGVQRTIIISMIINMLAAFLSLLWVYLRPKTPTRKIVSALVVPPITMAFAYQISLGFYGNFHAGYHIASYVTAAWACSAGVVALLLLIRDSSKRAGDFLGGVGVIVLSILLIGLSLVIAKKGPAWDSGNNVNFQEYSSRVFDEMPEGASAWGSVIFGLESGRKTTLIQFGEGAALASDFTPAKRLSIAPDYIVANDLLTFAILSAIRKDGSANFLATMHDLFPDTKYALAKLVDGAPYGTTRIYQKVPLGLQEVPLTVNIYDRQRKAWDQALDRLEAIEDVMVAPPVEYSFSYGNTYKGIASRSVSVSLPKGNYILHVRLQDQAPAGGVLIATHSRNEVEAGSDLRFKTFDGPFAKGDQWVHILAESNGEKLFVSDLNGAAGAFKVVYAQKILGRNVEYVKQTLPPLTQWKGWNDRIKLFPKANGTLEVDGSDAAGSGQIISPPIEVSKGSNIKITIPVQSNYDFQLSLINEDMNGYVIPPERNATMLFGNVGSHNRFRIALSSGDQVAASSPRKILLRQGELEYSGDVNRQYIEKLVECRVAPKSDLCATVRH